MTKIDQNNPFFFTVQLKLNKKYLADLLIIEAMGSPRSMCYLVTFVLGMCMSVHLICLQGKTQL